jgi:glutamyl-tRNA reductase
MDDLVRQLRRDAAEFDSETYTKAADRIEAQDKRNKELEAALQNIVIHCKYDSPPNAEALKLFARAALGEKNK